MRNNDILSIIIVTWNNQSEIAKCLDSIKKYPPKVKHSVWVVDNASTDNTLKILEKSYPWIKLIKNSVNEGFSKANNKALKQIHPQYALLLNPDTEVTNSAIDTLLNFLKTNGKVGACGALLINKDGSIQTEGYYRKLPSFWQVTLFYTNFNKFALRNSYLRQKYWEEEVLGDRPVKVEQIPGACLLIPYDLIKQLGFLNEEYPVWFEDVDLCYQIKKKELDLMLVPESKVYHLGGVSFEKWNESSKKEVRFYKSLFTFFSLNKSFPEFLLIKLIILINYFYLVTTRSLKQLINPQENRRIFIKDKWEILRCLLV